MTVIDLINVIEQGTVINFLDKDGSELLRFEYDNDLDALSLLFKYRKVETLKWEYSKFVAVLEAMKND